MRTRIKFCGITDVSTAKHACQLGVDAIGLMFVPQSVRAIDIATAQQIVKSLPPFITAVGVFANASDDWLKEVTDAVSLQLLQFHGDETEALCRRTAHPYIKALRVQEVTDLIARCAAYPNAQGFLLDSYDPHVLGGTGKTFPWQILPDLPKPCIVAGGLHATNVAKAITLMRPFGIDVSSGIESQPGKKDHATMIQFVTTVRQADAKLDNDT